MAVNSKSVIPAAPSPSPSKPEMEIFSGIRVVVDTPTDCAMCLSNPSKRGILCVSSASGKPYLCCRTCATTFPSTEKPKSARPLPIAHALAFVSKEIASRYPPEQSEEVQKALSAVCQSW